MTVKSESEYECSDCGATIERGDRFCKKCGAKLEWAEEQLTSQPVESPLASTEAPKPRFWKKWSWGWYILLGITYFALQKAYTRYGLYDGLIAIAGVIIAGLLYYVLRKKLLRRISKVWIRSLCSGAIAYVIVAFAMPVLTLFIPTQRDRVARVIHAEALTLKSNTEHFTERDNQLWSRFIRQPATNKDFRYNLAIVAQSIPLYRQKDSVAIQSLKNIYSSAEDIYSESTSSDSTLSLTLVDFQTLIASAQQIAVYHQTMLSNLSEYYKSLLSADGNDEQYWQAYTTTVEQLNVVSQGYSQLAAQLFGNDMTEPPNDKSK